MGINVTTSSVNSTTSTQSSSSTQSKNSSAESFKDEFDKVASEGDKKVSKSEEKSSTEIEDKVENKQVEEVDNKQNNETTDKKELESDQVLEGEVSSNNMQAKDLMNMNNILANDIKQMVNTNALHTVKAVEATQKTSELHFGKLNFDSTNSISMTQADAEFFINLTKNDTVTAQNVVAQAQNMLNNGAEVTQVKQNVQISEALLNAINKAKETNQPLRIDFDQNVAVILKIGKDGSLAANFIPGDKAVEQYLRNNIENLKATFRDNDLPYTELSYSNRGSKQQKENRRNKQ